MNDDSRPVSAPAGLGVAGRKLWRDVARFWADDDLHPDPRELRALADAAREADQLARMEAELERDGRLMVRGSMGQEVAHPLIAECRRSRSQIAACMKMLGFDAPDSASTAGLPEVRALTVAEAGRKGGRARHAGGR